MSRTLSLYVARLFVSFFAFILLGVTALYLLVDYGDRQRYFNELATDALVRLYAFRGIIALQQLAPAAMLLASGATLSALRQRGEWTAMQSLGISRVQILAPIIGIAALFGLALIGLDDQLVTRASLAAKDISPVGFQSFAAKPQAGNQRWFRVDHTFIQVRGAQADDAFLDVTMYEMTDDFRLRRRIDSPILKSLGKGHWRAEKAQTRTFETDGSSKWTQADVLELDLGQLTPEAFLLNSLLPEELRFSQLSQQLRIREALGMPLQAFAYMTHLRIAYPLMGVAAALLAAFLALRTGRRGHLTTVLIEGVAVAFLLMTLLTVARTLVMSGRIAPWIAAWLPVAGMLVAVAVETANRKRVQNRAANS